MSFRAFRFVSNALIRCCQRLSSVSEKLFSLCGFPNDIHTYLGRSFTSRELKECLLNRGITSSHSIPYHHTGNAHVE